MLSPMPRAPLHRLRALCLALPEAEERETWGEANFRVHAKIFVLHLHNDGAPAFWCKAPPGSQHILVNADPARFFTPPYLGHKGWVGVHLTRRPDWQEIAVLIRRSYTLVAPRRLARLVEPAARLALAAFALFAASPAAAQTAEAFYIVRQAGLRVMEARVVMDLDRRGYRITTESRTTGLAVLFANSSSLVRVEGLWRGHAAMPSSFDSSGTWNGRARQVRMRYRGEDPELLALDPPDAGERVAVTAEERRGTVDIISALARLARESGATGQCNGEAAVFDGRRRLQWSVRTQAGDAATPAGGPWPGPLLRCAFSSRLVAGFRLRDDPPAAGRAREGVVWLATVRPDLPPLPVRVVFGSGLFGTLRAELVSIGAPGEARTDGSGDEPVQQRR